MQLEIGLYLLYGDKSAAFSSSSTLSRQGHANIKLELEKAFRFEPISITLIIHNSQ